MKGRVVVVSGNQRLKDTAHRIRGQMLEECMVMLLRWLFCLSFCLSVVCCSVLLLLLLKRHRLLQLNQKKFTRPPPYLPSFFPSCIHCPFFPLCCLSLPLPFHSVHIAIIKHRTRTVSHYTHCAQLFGLETLKGDKGEKPPMS